VRKHETSNCKIWEAARATSADPRFFKRIDIGDPTTSKPYIDGGVGCNNPIAQLLDEAALVFSTRKVACVISIGSGKPATIGIQRPALFQLGLPGDVVKAMRAIAMDCENSAEEVARRFHGLPGVYFRFNVEQGMQAIGLDQWERLNEVATHTDQYMRTQEVDHKLDAALSAIRERRAFVPTAQIGMKTADVFVPLLFDSIMFARRQSRIFY
jgi:predicted acylesterase/phospholipase RssA